MKKIVPAIFLIIFSAAVLSLCPPESELTIQTLADFDPGAYETTNAPQEFRLYSHSRDWYLSAVASYHADGTLDSETVYQLDTDGQAYTGSGASRRNTSRMPRPGFSGIEAMLTYAPILDEEYDDYGRITVRTAQTSDSCTRTAAFHYCPNSAGTGEDNEICSYVETVHYAYGPNEAYDFAGQPLTEETCYTIINFDRYGNETMLMIDGTCCMKTDGAGYLQMIVQEHSNSYEVTRVDRAGRPLVKASYLKSTGELSGYSVWTYTDLDT